MNIAKKSFSRLKLLVSVSLIMALLSFSFVGETGAWLVSTSGADSTTMTKASVSVKINGSGGPAAAYITNTGTIPVYIRVIPVVNWVNDQDNNWYDSGTWSGTRQYLARSPIKGAAGSTVTNNDGSTSTADYTFTVRSADWLETTVTETVGNTTVKYTVLYYRKPLAANDNTSTMFSAFTAHGAKSKELEYAGKDLTYKLTTDFLVDAIQCESSCTSVNDTAAVQKWKVTLSGIGGNITAGPTADFQPS